MELIGLKLVCAMSVYKIFFICHAIQSYGFSGIWGKNLNQKIIFKLENGNKITLLEMKNSIAKRVGLLNHCSLPKDEGVIYKKNKIFHTFGMNFSIAVFCMDKKMNVVCKPIVVEKNSLFIVPRESYYVAEVNNELCNLFDKEKLSRVKIFTQEKAKIIFFVLRYFKVFCILLLMLFVSYAVFAQDDIKISLGRTRVLDLGKPPLTIQISDPDILSVERVGITNSIKIIPKQEGESKITIVYPEGGEVNWNVHIGNKNVDTSPNSLEPFMSSLGENKSTPAINTMVKKINKIVGLKASAGGAKIVIIGEIKSFDNFMALSKIIAANPTLFFPAYDIPMKFEIPIISALQSDLRLFGERNLKIINRRGVLTLIGVPSSAVGKVKAWNYLSGLVPNIVDALSSQVGDSSIVQVNLDFLELAKGEGTEFGFTQPLFSNVSADLNFPAGLISKGIQEPTLQIGPISSLFKALQNSSFARELAKPVVITRSGEKASFLAGGEVPIVTATSTTAATTSSVTYKPFGILFNVTPRVQVDGDIWIKLELEVSQISEDLSYQNIPGFTSRKVNTSIILNEGNTALLSGLVQNKDVKQVQKIPLLGSIPIIGELFKSRRFQENDTELWVAITAIRADHSNHFSEKFIENKFNSAKSHSTGSLLD